MSVLSSGGTSVFRDPGGHSAGCRGLCGQWSIHDQYVSVISCHLNTLIYACINAKGGQYSSHYLFYFSNLKDYKNHLMH